MNHGPVVRLSGQYNVSPTKERHELPWRSRMGLSGSADQEWWAVLGIDVIRASWKARRRLLMRRKLLSVTSIVLVVLGLGVIAMPSVLQARAAAAQSSVVMRSEREVSGGRTGGRRASSRRPVRTIAPLPPAASTSSARRATHSPIPPDRFPTRHTSRRSIPAMGSWARSSFRKSA